MLRPACAARSTPACASALASARSPDSRLSLASSILTRSSTPAMSVSVVSSSSLHAGRLRLGHLARPLTDRGQRRQRIGLKPRGTCGTCRSRRLDGARACQVRVVGQQRPGVRREGVRPFPAGRGGRQHVDCRRSRRDRVLVLVDVQQEVRKALHRPAEQLRVLIGLLGKEAGQPPQLLDGKRHLPRVTRA